jgi:hypothetical protein
MLKTVSSVANAIGALNYKGTWNATTNTPTLTSGVGTQGDYYVVSVAGATSLDGITNWGVGDWATFNGSVWQRVEGGADGNFVNLDVTGTGDFGGTVTAAGLTVFGTSYIQSTTQPQLQIAYNSGNITGFYRSGGDFQIKNDNGVGSPETSIVLAEDGAVTLYYDASPKISTQSTGISVTGNISVDSGSGIDFSATAGTGTSELFDDYEEGTWTPSTIYATFVGAASSEGTYTKIGRVVVARGSVTGATSVTVGASGILTANLPFNSASNAIGTMAASTNTASGNIRTSGPFLVATDTISPVSSITFTVTYFT